MKRRCERLKLSSKFECVEEFKVWWRDLDRDQYGQCFPYDIKLFTKISISSSNITKKHGRDEKNSRMWWRRLLGIENLQICRC